MRVYLLRHGAAESGKPGSSDRDRSLTDEGREQVRLVARLAAAAAERPSVVLASPYVRAIETARIAACEMGYEGTVVESEALTPDSNPYAVWDELRERSGEAAVLLAGHEPLMGETVAYLLASSRPVVHMVKAALVRIDVDRYGPNPAATLQWMITPELGKK